MSLGSVATCNPKDDPPADWLLVLCGWQFKLLTERVVPCSDES